MFVVLLFNHRVLRNFHGVNELMVDGFLANVGIGIVPLFCSLSLAKEVLVLVACGTDSVSLGVAQ